MSFGDCIFLLLIEPLKLLFEVLFFYAYKFSGNVGLSIIVMSLAVNFLVLPLYKQADVLQTEERDLQNKMSPYIKHIKSTFKGDERFFMLQEYYRINNYKPIYALKSSISLFLQIPFFVAAYSFLSELKLIQGVSLGPIADLGCPDSLIVFGGMNINVLPILMTCINIFSIFIYTEKASFKDRAKLVLVACVFLALLYNSPAGLVFYWTLNNVFSLIKSIILRLHKPDSKIKTISKNVLKRKDMINVILSCAVLAILTGVMIPSSIIADNPAELVNTFISNPHSPLEYLFSSALISFGTFLIWVPMFYFLLVDKNRENISRAFVAIASVGVLNSIAFNKNFGMLTYRLIYEKPMQYKISEILINLIVDIIVVALIVFIGKKISSFMKIIVVLLLCVIVISGTSIGFFLFAYNGADYDVNSSDEISIQMTSTGQNVVVIMMDRMIGAYIPYIFAEHPEIASRFDGFTYYPNTISFGPSTNTASPALFGGYEYTPDKLNARSDELLKDKHNEALLVLPTIFADDGWHVTVGDMPYVNYEWLSDTSIFDDNPNIDAYHFSRAMKSGLLSESGQETEDRLNRNFFCYGLMKTFPYIFQPLLYSEGSYNYFYNDSLDDNINGTHIRNRLVLASLSDFVDITDSSQNCFFIFDNETTHEVCLLSDDKYDGPLIVNDTALYLDDEEDYMHYQCNVEACILLGQWFDFLRENDLYNNTRIILVADHGYGLNNFDELLVMDADFDAEWVNPVLMVKDFNQNDFTVVNDLMTNADTPYLAVSGVIDNPVNPFTGVPITHADKTGDQLIYVSHEWNTVKNNGTQYKDSNAYWLTVHNNIWDDENWNKYENMPEG